MNFSIKRRKFLVVAAAMPLIVMNSSCAKIGENDQSVHLKLAELERNLNGRLGLFALNTASGIEISFRSQERFPMCSTFKILLVAAILNRSIRAPEFIHKTVRYTKAELVPYSPVTEKHIESGMSIADLCSAALQVSDNTAANLLIKIIGGPCAVTDYTRSLGDQEFRLDRLEPDLNSAVPEDDRDTTTPQAMALSIQKLVLGDALPSYQSQQLRDWLLGNKTGALRIRAGVPDDWRVADKTGTGFYGTTNDVAVLWPHDRPPIILVIYTTQPEKDSDIRNDIIASAAHIVARAIIEEI